MLFPINRLKGAVLKIPEVPGEVFVLFVLIASAVNYDWLFTAFHNLFFDPYSWRFRDEER